MSRTLLAAGVIIALFCLAGCRAGEERLRKERLADDVPATIQVRSDAFADGQPIPRRYATDENLSPPVSWSNLPPSTRSVVLLMEDPDAPGMKPYVHWLVYNVPPSQRTIPEGRPQQARLRAPFEAMQGRNSAGGIGYVRPAPPPGDKPHRYLFKVYAIDRVLPASEALARDELFRLVDGRVVAKGELVGTYHQP